MKLLNMLLGRRETEGVRGHDDPVGVPASEGRNKRRTHSSASEVISKSRTPEEAKARRKAYKRRKAAKAARRRNRK